MNEQQITDLGVKSVAAGAMSADLSAAIDDERAAEALVLERVIAAASPGLRAICGRLCTRHASWSTNEGTVFHESEDRYPVSGAWLAGATHAEEDHPRSDGGSYEGSALWILGDGSLVEINYGGSWSRWQGAKSEWTTEVKTVTPLEAMDSWELDEVIAVLSSKFDKVLAGKAPERASAARARAERLRAIAVLVK